MSELEGIVKALKSREEAFEFWDNRLQQHLIHYCLLGSLKNGAYKFPEVASLKPGVKLKKEAQSEENKKYNSALLVFTKKPFTKSARSHFRFKKNTRVLTGNFGPYTAQIEAKSQDPEFVEDKVLNNFDQKMRRMDHPNFWKLFDSLLPVDYALCIQTPRKSLIPQLTDLHILIDWMEERAVKHLAKNLRYIKRSLSERDDEYIQMLEDKFYNYFALHPSVSGRRLSAIVAAQLLQKLRVPGTVYVSSSEDRSLIRIEKDKITRSILLPIEAEKVEGLKERAPDFYEFYVHERNEGNPVVTFQVEYERTEYGLSPEDGKLRDLHDADIKGKKWIKIASQNIMPIENSAPPIDWPVVYEKEHE